MEVLERPAMSTMDRDVIVLDRLTDNEFGLIQEYRELYKSGFTVEQAKEMMGADCYEMAIAVMQKVEQDLERLTIPPMRQLTPKAKKREKSGMEFDHEIED